MSDETRRRAAIHEAGHAIVGRSLGHNAIVDLSLHDGGGEAQFEPPVDGAATLPQLEAALAMLLAGRAAEEIAFGDISIGSGLGSGSDLAQATALARNIDLQFGLGKLGPYYVDPAHDALFLVHGLVETVTDRLRAAYARASSVLKTQTPVLRAVASELAEAGYLSAKDVDRIIQAYAAPAHPVEMPVPALAVGAD
jgi:ATP-dependent Zn protease